MNSTIGIKITSADSFAKVVSIIRKYEPLSISEIKQRISEDKYILSYGYTNDKGVKIITKCYCELVAQGISVQLYEHDVPCELQFLKNLSNMYQEISDEVDAEIEAESDDE